MKTFFSSKTMWFGMFQIAFGAVGLMMSFLDQQTAFALIMTGFGAIGLRFATTKPIGTPE